MGYLEEIEAAERARLADAAGNVPLFPGDTQLDIPTPLAGGGEIDAAAGLPDWLPEAVSTVLIGGLILGVIPGLKALRRRRRLQTLKTGDISGVWAEIVDRLTDHDAPPSPTDTPREHAAERPELRPLAAAYSRQAYGPPGRPSDAALETARRSYEATAQELRDTSWPQRIAAAYRIKSLFRR